MKPACTACSTRTVATALVLATAALAGCMPAHREAPALARITTPQAWTTPTGGNANANANANASLQAGGAMLQPQWWQSFGDATLSRHIEAARAYNTDLLAAGARLEAALAQVALARSAIGPTLGGSVGVQAQRSLGAAGVGTSRTVQPGVQAAWEPDLWGRLRTQVSAAEFRLLASQAERDAAALSISAATAQTYIALLALNAQLKVTQNTAASRAEALRIAEDKARVGYISQLQVTQAQSEYEAVLQSLPQLQTAIARQYNALRLLTGELPDTLPAESARPDLFAKLQLPPVPVALPSELLRRRPDLAQAESLLAASDASLQASRAAFLPQVSLSASLGSLYINALNYNPASVWSLGGSVLAPLFDQGRLSAQYDQAAAQRDQAAFAYRGATLNAFGEVENALVGVNRLQEQLDRVVRRREVLQRSVNYAKDRYEAGYAPYLEQLDAQRNLYQTEIEVINVRQSQLVNQLNLYKALGGGWSAELL